MKTSNQFADKVKALLVQKGINVTENLIEEDTYETSVKRWYLRTSNDRNQTNSIRVNLTEDVNMIADYIYEVFTSSSYVGCLSSLRDVRIALYERGIDVRSIFIDDEFHGNDRAMIKVTTKNNKRVAVVFKHETSFTKVLDEIASILESQGGKTNVLYKFI